MPCTEQALISKAQTPFLDSVPIAWYNRIQWCTTSPYINASVKPNEAKWDNKEFQIMDEVLDATEPGLLQYPQSGQPQLYAPNPQHLGFSPNKLKTWFFLYSRQRLETKVPTTLTTVSVFCFGLLLLIVGYRKSSCHGYKRTSYTRIFPPNWLDNQQSAACTTSCDAN